LWVINKLGGILYDQGKKKLLIRRGAGRLKKILIFIKDRAKRFIIFESLLSIVYCMCCEMKKDAQESYREAVSYILFLTKLQKRQTPEKRFTLLKIADMKSRLRC
jgi:hypothetical protein